MVKEKQSKGRQDSGFTLIELIIVIAIMAVLVGVLAGQYIRYIEKTRKAVCLQNMDNAITGFSIAQIDSTETPMITMDSVMKDMGITVKHSGVYTGVCPSGGIVTYEAGVDGDYHLYCDKHQSSSVSGLSSVLLNSIINNWKNIIRNGTTLYTYLNDNTRLTQLDSNRANYGGSSWVSLIQDVMNKATPAANSQSWSLVKQKASTDFTFMVTTDGTISNTDLGKKVNVVSYTYDKDGNLKSGPNYTKATVSTVTDDSKNTYAVIR